MCQHNHRPANIQRSLRACQIYHHNLTLCCLLVFSSPKPGTKGPQNGVDLLKRAKFVGQNTKLWRPVVHQHNPAGAVGYHDTAPQSICILAKLGTQPPHGSKLPGRIWQNNGRRGEDEFSATHGFLPNLSFSRLQLWWWW